MSLSALIRKRDTGNLATAIPAISATQPKGEVATVARIATVAVANYKEEKTALATTHSEPANETPTPQEQANLARLVARVGRAHDWPDADIRLAIKTALANYWDALTCYTDLAKQAGMYLEDDRRMCFECAELSGSYCMAARRGELHDADRRYEPIRYLPRRCQGYKPKLSERN